MGNPPQRSRSSPEGSSTWRPSSWRLPLGRSHALRTIPRSATSGNVLSLRLRLCWSCFTTIETLTVEESCTRLPEGARSEEAGSIFISFSLFLPNLETLNCPFIDHCFNPFIITYTPWAFCLVAIDPNPSCQHSILHSKHCLFLSSLPSFVRAVRVNFILFLHGVTNVSG